MSHRVRESVIAGQWYPGNPRQLENLIQRYLQDVEPVALDGDIVGLISPHAGYAYSGQTAAYAYNQIRGASFDVVAVLSPVHRMPVGRFAVTSAGAYETPLGTVPIDQDALQELAKRVTVSRVGYDGEHSLEIQLPFLQVVLDELRILPVMIGDSSFSAGEELGLALAEVLRGQNSLIIASTDLHHMYDYDELVRRDQVVVDAIASYDLDRTVEALSAPDCSVCGRVPVFALLTAAKALHANGIKVLHHTNSSKVTGRMGPGQYTVGYMAAAVYRNP